MDTWDINIEEIRSDPDNGELAIKLLVLISCLDPVGVKDELLFILLNEAEAAGDSCNFEELGYQVIYDAITVIGKEVTSVEYFESTAKAKRALDLLHRYSLVTSTDSVISMHRLVQEDVRRKVMNEEIYYGY